MAGEKNGVTGGQSLDEGSHLPDLTWVEADRRLIEDQDVGFVDQGIRKADTLTIPFGEGPDDLPLDMA